MKKLAILAWMVPMIGLAQVDPNGDSVHFQRTKYQVQADGNLNQLKGDGNLFAYRQTIWMSGTSYGSDTIAHLSAQEYRASRVDFYPGPISTDPSATQHWDRTWTVTKGMIDSLRNGLYTTIPEPIQSWPTQGRSQFGERQSLAPYVDVDNDGSYDPAMGDYPAIKGDISTIAIFNDWNDRGFYQYWAFQMEGIAWYYMVEGTGVEQRAVFTEYEMWNTSSNSYEEAWVSVFSDLDVGDAFANNIGTDAQRHSVYAYPYSPLYAGGPAYPTKSPWGAVTILEGPTADVGDGVDNNWDGCVDGVVDAQGNCISENPSAGIEEPTTLQTSMGYNNTFVGHNRVPQMDAHYRMYMLGRWVDGSFIKIENPSGFNSLNNGDGHNPSVAQGISSFIFPGNSYAPDPLVAAVPNADINFFESPAESYDKRVIGSAGPFTWDPNEKITFAYATLWGTVDTSNFMNIIDSIGAEIDQLQIVHQTIGVDEIEIPSLKLVVGQDDEHLYAENPHGDSFEFEILDINGRALLTGRIGASTKTQIRTTALAPGVYILRTTDALFATKWIKQP